MGPSARIYKEKTEVLTERFFPNPTTDLKNIEDTIFTNNLYKEYISVLQNINNNKIVQILHYTKSWKAPEVINLFPVGFLKAYGPPLWKILMKIITASLEFEYFP